MYIKYYRLTMVIRCVAKEVQRNAKWGYLMWIRESGQGGKGEWMRWKRRMG